MKNNTLLFIHQAGHGQDCNFQQPTVSSRMRENQFPERETTVPWIPTSPHSPSRQRLANLFILLHCYIYFSLIIYILVIYIFSSLFDVFLYPCFTNFNMCVCSVVASRPEPRCLFSSVKSPEKLQPQVKSVDNTQLSPSSHDRKQVQNEALRSAVIMFCIVIIRSYSFNFLG